MIDVRSVEVDKIKVSETRYRTEFTGIEELAESIEMIGQLIPIIITPDYTLLAGERRLMAHKLLQKPTIIARIMSLDDIGNKIVELTENLEREDFNWQEKVLARKDLHEMMCAKYGKRWSERKTAEKTGISKSTLSDDINLAEAIIKMPEVFEDCKSKQQALKTLKKYKIDEAMIELTMRKKRESHGVMASSMIQLGDCLKLIDKLPDKSIDSVISDPIFGIDVFDMKFKNPEIPKQREFNDKETSFEDIMFPLIKKLDRVMKPNASIALFCGFKWFSKLREALQKIGFSIDELPAIWFKGYDTARCSAPDKYFNRCYEFILYGTRGNACLAKQGTSNVIQEKSVKTADRIHPSQKPVELMEELISRLCLPGQVILDPMAGSGATIIAGIRRNMFPLGFEIDKVFYNSAILAITKAIEEKNAGVKHG